MALNCQSQKPIIIITGRDRGQQWGLIFREFYRWLIEHIVPRSKIDCSQKRCYKIIQPEKGRVEEQEAKDSYSN